MKQVRLDFTTDTSGDADITGDTVVGGGGTVFAIDYVPTSIDTGATVTITDEFLGASFTIWVQASAGTSTIREFPRTLEQLNTDGSDLSTHAMPLICGRPKVVIASGGAVKTGYVILHLMEI